MHKLLMALALVLATVLTACSKSEAPATATSAATPAAYQLVASGAKGFTVGPVMSAHTVYVLFDPQCPHCGHLWAAAQPLTAQVKFVWVPVAIINGNSALQGAALLGASNPVQAMNLHEAAILAGTGGTTVRDTPPVELTAQVRKNTEIFTQLQLESVPFVITRDASTGQVRTQNAALDTAALAQWLGVTSPL